MKSIKIGEKEIGEGSPCFIIAEAGVNHNGDFVLAKKLIEVASKAGADAVKFQTFSSEKLVIHSAPKAEYQKRTTDIEESHLNMLKKLELSLDAHEKLIKYALEKNIIFLSTPFDEDSADLLENLGILSFKVSSGDINNLPFLTHLSTKGRPMIVSTGMATLDEVSEAYETITKNGCEELVFLHCTSNYPTEFEDVNLKAMNTMREKFEIPIGYSDHTPGTTVTIAAVAMGAAVLEKHFTMDRSLLGPDHLTSLEPDELEKMIREIRIVEAALGSTEKKPVDSELQMQKIVRKSIVSIVDIPKETIINRSMIALKRPGTGLQPKQLSNVINKKARVDIKKNELITQDMIE